MKFRIRSGWLMAGIAVMMILLMAACGQSSNPDPTATPGNSPSPIEQITPTPTTIPGGDIEIETPPVASKCSGLSGELEMQVLVGPAEAVGLEPVSVGYIPFSVVSEGGVYLVEGEGALSYDETLEEVWGTYSVSLNMDGSLEGECVGEPGNEGLQIIVEMSGEQMVEVRSEGFQGDYPWSGTQTLELSFPLEDGASAEGEGWSFILHLPE